MPKVFKLIYFYLFRKKNVISPNFKFLSNFIVIKYFLIYYKNKI